MQRAYLSSAVHVVEPVFMYKCMHGTVQVSSFSFEPMGECKACLHAANNCWERYKPRSNEIPLDLISGGGGGGEGL